MRLAIHDDGRTDAAQSPIDFELFNLNRCGIGQFITNQAKKLFADVFGGDEFFALVGNLVLTKQQLVVWQVFARFSKQILKLTSLCRADRNDGRKSMLLGELGQNRQ